MKFVLEHRLPKRLRFAKVYLEAGSASVSISIDGTSADWHASIGRKREAAEMSDREYTRLRTIVPAVQTLEDDGKMLVIRNANGYEEEWLKPTWTLAHIRKRSPKRQD